MGEGLNFVVVSDNLLFEEGTPPPLPKANNFQVPDSEAGLQLGQYLAY